MASIVVHAGLLYNWRLVSQMSQRVLKPMKGLFDLGKLKSKCGARHCLFCAGINDQSHFPAASPGFAHRCFRKTGASTMPRVNDLKIAIEIP